MCRAQAGVGQSLIISMLALEVEIRDKFSSVFSVLVNLLRQVVLSLNGAKVTRNFVLGDCHLDSVAPPLSDGLEESLNWQGSLTCREDVGVGTFDTDILNVNVSCR